MSVNSDKTPTKFSVQGSFQFHAQKATLLAEYDAAKAISQYHKHPAYRGRVAEASFRKWLTNFLPKRYGVTSGYIVSQGLTDREAMPHFDVIIYDALNSPVLWSEPNHDTSGIGESRALLAEHVLAVVEVKSAFHAKSTAEARDHLFKLKPLLEQNNPAKRFARYLPDNFTSYAVFYELCKPNDIRPAALQNLVPKTSLRGFGSALILRGEGMSAGYTCRLTRMRDEGGKDGRPERIITNIGPRLHTMCRERGSFWSGENILEDVPPVRNWLYGVWTENAFSQFAFYLLKQLAGEPTGGISTLIGMSWVDGRDGDAEPTVPFANL